MGKLISLGEYNKLYKYLWIYLSIKIISSYIFGSELVFDQFKNDVLNLPYNNFVSNQIYYIGFIIISLVLVAIQKLRKKIESKTGELTYGKLIFNKIDIQMEYGLSQSDNFLYLNLFFVVIIDLLDIILYAFKCDIFNYWTFEILFFERFNARLFNTKIYKHHTFSLIFILCFCSIIQTIIIILNFVNDLDYIKIFVLGKWLIPLGLIINFLANIFRAYVYNNEKYYLEKRIISIRQYLLLYGLYGTLTTFICAILSTYIPCGDNSLPELSKIVCSYTENEEIYYFDSYKIFFNEFSSNYLGIRIILEMIDTILYYTYNYFIYVIYKKLNPIYHICMRRLAETILTFLKFINYLINNDNINNLDISLSILNILLLTFFILGSIVYLEFIELNFCELNFYVKRKIKERSNTESVMELDNLSVNSDTSN